MKHFDSSNIFRTLPSRSSGYTFFSSARGTFTEIPVTILSKNHGIKLEVKDNELSRKFSNIWKYSNTVKKIKKQATDWDKILTKHIPDKTLISRI